MGLNHTPFDFSFVTEVERDSRYNPPRSKIPIQPRNLIALSDLTKTPQLSLRVEDGSMKKSGH